MFKNNFSIKIYFNTNNCNKNNKKNITNDIDPNEVLFQKIK